MLIEYGQCVMKNWHGGLYITGRMCEQKEIERSESQL